MLPNPADLRQEPTNLEAYKKSGPYRDSHNYLQTLTSLFREDAIRGLRKGIAQLQNRVQMPRDVGLFHNVRIGATVVNERFGDVVTDLSFNFGPHKNVDWASSMWLSRGSLLCLSSDGFNTDIIFATGHYRESELTCGPNPRQSTARIKVVFADEMLRKLRRNRTYVMMEGTFYLPYANVLAALQSLGARFPFQAELVQCQQSARGPAYLQCNPVHIADGSILGVAQAKAVRQALSHRFAVIQGPPDEMLRKLRRNRTYVMMEGTFYLPYANVLAALQSLGARFPFQAELVQCQQSARGPAYLQCNPVHIADGSILGVAQAKAVRQALSHRFAVIQGPPGTGKTFIGLRIVIALLIKSHLWHHSGPILIVCTTNHALDQFLEGIVKGNAMLAPGDVLRFGGQSQSELLKRFNASEQNTDSEAVKSELRPSGRELHRCTEELQSLLANDHSSTSARVLDLAASVRRLQTRREQIRTVGKLRVAKVVGMTTTYAAMKHRALQEVGPPIVIVEEAAEVLEAHQLAVLSAQTEHLIIIGDHQQLRPKTASNDLSGTPHHLDLSLFERLVTNGFPYTQLDTQRRMRPEISTLMKLPPFYPRLQDDSSVRGRPSIRGMALPVFFWFHNIWEADQRERREDETSRKNPGEADMVVSLANHLRLQGYGSAAITVITFYASQVDVIRSKLRVQSATKDVEVRSVDGYQGEENEIIILSTVRSSARGTIGFLSNLNRATVAFSRARNGLYVVGNLPHLAEFGRPDESTRHNTWDIIHNSVVARGIGGLNLRLRCQTHNNELIVSSSLDMQRLSPFGGCGQLCKARLSCGHTCDTRCHTTAFEHQLASQCSKPCLKRCPENHACKGRCKEPCPPCPVLLIKTLACGHTTPEVVACHSQPTCLERCKRQCPFGHRCKAQCSKLCPPCREPRKIQLICGHMYDDKCFKTGTSVKKLEKRAAAVICPERCARKLRCNHLCQDMCAKKPCPPCPIQLIKTLACGHETRKAVSCGAPPPLCKESCRRRCAFGHRCKAQCADLCPPCHEPREIHPMCGHSYVAECHKDSIRCNVACPKVLPCGHACSGICGQPCPPCPVQEIFMLHCGHQTEVVIVCNDREAYRCPKPCERVCPALVHGCRQPCWKPCRPCWRHDFRLWASALLACFHD